MAVLITLFLLEDALVALAAAERFGDKFVLVCTAVSQQVTRILHCSCCLHCVHPSPFARACLDGLAVPSREISAVQ